MTPVRRSRRLYNDEDYVATKEEMMAATAKGQEHQEKHQDESTSSSSSSGPTTPSTSNDRYKQQGDQLSKLLAEHGFAYVPNKAFPLPQTKTPLSGGGIGGSGSGGAGGGRRVSRAGHTPFQRSTARAATPRKYSGSASEEES